MKYTSFFLTSHGGKVLTTINSTGLAERKECCVPRKRFRNPRHAGVEGIPLYGPGSVVHILKVT